MFKKVKEKSITITKYWRYEHFTVEVKGSWLKQVIKKIVNGLIFNFVGLELVKVKKSTSYRPEQRSFSKNRDILDIRNERLCSFLINFFSDFGLNFKQKNVLMLIERYEEIFRNEKISDLNGGMGFNNGLILFLLVSYFNPKVTIESGIWRGYTTLLIDEAISDDSKIFCFDINLDRKEYSSTKASYFECDITEVNNLDYKIVDFAFFDDHVSIYDRLMFCIENNIRAVVVDDDVGVTQVHSDGWPPIPTASMIYDYANIPKQFDWFHNGMSANADIDGLSVSKICDFYAYIPLPSLSHLTGYKDTSFTSLLLKRNV